MKKIRVNWNKFCEYSSNASDTLADFAFGGKSLKAISPFIKDKELILELEKAKKLKVRGARIGAKRVLNKWYSYSDNKPYELTWVY